MSGCYFHCWFLLFTYIKYCKQIVIPWIKHYCCDLNSQITRIWCTCTRTLLVREQQFSNMMFNSNRLISCINIESLMICDSSWFLSNELCFSTPEPSFLSHLYRVFCWIFSVKVIIVRPTTHLLQDDNNLKHGKISVKFNKQTYISTY